MRYPTAPKVKAAGATAGLGALALQTALSYVTGHQTQLSGQIGHLAVAALVWAGTHLAGYLAPHQDRPVPRPGAGERKVPPFH
jgi:hypothetical protein